MKRAFTEVHVGTVALEGGPSLRSGKAGFGGEGRAGARRRPLGLFANPAAKRPQLGRSEPALPEGPYSYLRARIGSIRLARCAGIRPASAETVVNSSIVLTAIHGSRGWIP